MEGKFKLDQAFLEGVGLGDLGAKQADTVLRQTYETLERRVGVSLAGRMTDSQLDEFESFVNANDEAGALSWLESNFPDYQQTVRNHLNDLRTEISDSQQEIRDVLGTYLAEGSSEQPGAGT